MVVGTASAAVTTVTVSQSSLITNPASSPGWYFWNDKDDTLAGSPGSFVKGPATAPAGAGSVKLGPLTDDGTTAGGYSAIATVEYVGTPLTSINAMSYQTYQSGTVQAVALQFDVKYRPSDSAYGGRLVFEPYQQPGGVLSNTWQSWDTINGKWWASKTNAAGSAGNCPQASPCTWADILAAFPNATINGRLLLRSGSGSGWIGFDGSADLLSITTGVTNTTQYDFEPECVTSCYVNSSTGNDANGGGTAGTAKATIQAAINSVDPGATINVAAGTYTEDLVIGKALTLQGPGTGCGTAGACGGGVATISGPIGGVGSSTIQVTTTGVIVDGFTITRAGNNTTDWNNAGLNSAGVAVQGMTAAVELRHNLITGMRTAIDLNNTNNNNIHDNTIDFNRTGVILRNQTDNTTFLHNVVTNNWTVGILFLDGSGGSNSPVQTAINSHFNNNNISTNWYGQVVDRQSGGSLPTPGTTNLKNFGSNNFNSGSSVTTANSTEPGYAAQIPVAYGGSATDPGGATDILGSASANIIFLAPNAPIIGSAGAGNMMATVSFTAGAPVANNPAPITFTATCGSQSNTGASSPITVMGLTNGVTVSCVVKASNLAGDSANSAASNSVTPNNLHVDLTAVPGAVPEGDSGTTNTAWTLTKTGTGATVVSFSLAGSATYTEDFTISGPGVAFDPMTGTGTVTFASGTVSRNINISVKGDTKYEQLDTETATLSLTGSTNGFALGFPTMDTLSIDNSMDTKPTISVNVPNGAESAGPRTITVSLSNKTYQTVTYTASTMDGTAVAPADYTATTHMGTILPDSLSDTFTVNIIDDTLDEPTENFSVMITAYTNADPSTLTNSGNITDVPADPKPTISIADSSVVEGNSGTVNMVFTLTLSGPSGKTITVRAGTTPDTIGPNPATAPSDYSATPATTLITFSPGSTVQTYSVQVNGDTVLEPNETFLVQLTSPNVNLDFMTGTHVATGTIINDDSPAISIDDPSIAEGNSGTTILTFNVTIPSPAPVGGVGFTYNTSDGTATIADLDYVTASGTGSIPAGSTSTTIAVTINGDTKPEASETVNVTLTNPTGTGATLQKAVGVGTINNDDAIPAGVLVISEFRLRGAAAVTPFGQLDEFIEVANATNAAVTVFTTDGSSGFSVAKAPGNLIFLIPNGTTIPAYGHYLGANNTAVNGYTLKDYGGVNMSTPDATWTADIADDTGLALFATANPVNYTMPYRLDAAGFTTDVVSNPLYVEGPTGLAGIGNGGGSGFSGQYSFVRRYNYGGGSGLQDTNNNATNFALIATDAGSYGGSTATLGGPSPEKLTAEVDRTNAELTLGAIDPATDANTGPNNYQFTPANPGVSSKFIELRRTFKNNTATNFTAVRFKVSSITTLNGNNPATEADFRVTSSAAVVTGFGTAQALTLETPPTYTTLGVTDATSPMGGLNSSLRGPTIASGATVAVNFKLFYTSAGKPGYFWVTAEAK
ncbi:MAG: Calx-beta domain-containing protein [Vicinamibacteria bacterium]